MQINLVGCGGHSRSVIPVVQKNGLNITGIFDDSFTGQSEEIYPSIHLVGALKDLKTNFPSVLAIGNNLNRKKAFESINVYEPALIHEAAYVESTVQFGRGNLVMGACFINSRVVIGDNNIINTGSIIEHECQIGHHNHIAIRATLAGRVKIGNLCFVGAGATIIDGVTIADQVVIGAGAVVVDDILKPGTYVGVPAKKLI